jgi:hypothetical protein
MVALTYSEVTVARAAPLTPRPSGKTSMASSIAFTRLPTPACIRYIDTCQKDKNGKHMQVQDMCSWNLILADTQNFKRQETA